jgi:hypothetical protein
METGALKEYVAGRIRSGVGRTNIKEELLALGWSEDEADLAYRDGLIACGAPVPTESHRPTHARSASTVDIVINVFSFILLGIVAGAAGTLYFQIVNRFFPDPLTSGDWYVSQGLSSAIHYSIAALLISFPLYFFALRLWFRHFREEEGRLESKLSKWLTYLVLLVTAVTIVGDLITLVFTFLQGEITVRFFLKAFIILVIAGSVFGFYYLERRKIQYGAPIARNVFLAFGRGVTAFLALGIVLGFVASGSPATERSRTFDRTRVDDLSALSNCIQNYAITIGALPQSLDELRASGQYGYCGASMEDPETRLPYEYRIVTAARSAGAVMVGEFELCATFDLATDAAMGPSPAYYGTASLWYEHAAGRSCETIAAPLSPNAPATPPAGVK